MDSEGPRSKRFLNKLALGVAPAHFRQLEPARAPVPTFSGHYMDTMPRSGQKVTARLASVESPRNVRSGLRTGTSRLSDFHAPPSANQ
jgi:hypothetical protein